MGIISRIISSVSSKPTAPVASTASEVDALTLALARHIFDESPLTARKKKDWNDAQWKSIEEELNDIVAAPNPMMKCRESLSNSIIVMARYWVLVLKPPPEPEESGFRGLPGITGELYPRLCEIARANAQVRDALRGVNIVHPDGDDVYNYALFKYQQMYIRMMAFNYLRITIGDCGVGLDDWLRPYLHAMCAYQECIYRQELGMPSALGESKGFTIVGLQYSSFMNMVLSGEEYPDVTWRKAYAKNIAAGRLWIPDFGTKTA